mmetsp:Transcript_38423/g.59971  ORF Transcript_38423/g.59971 Transcript_38423/m.59971 type:complete len:153 (-) Transcript_38423:593-1051(-)
MELCSRFGYWKTIESGLRDRGSLAWRVPEYLAQGTYLLRVRQIGSMHSSFSSPSYPVQIRDTIKFLEPPALGVYWFCYLMKGIGASRTSVQGRPVSLVCVCISDFNPFADGQQVKELGLCGKSVPSNGSGGRVSARCRRYSCVWSPCEDRPG